jgi:ribosomal protein S20
VTVRAVGDKKAAKKRTDPAVKRAMLAKERRLYNKARKSACATRVKKVGVYCCGATAAHATRALAAQTIQLPTYSPDWSVRWEAGTQGASLCCPHRLAPRSSRPRAPC